MKLVKSMMILILLFSLLPEGGRIGAKEKKEVLIEQDQISYFQVEGR